MAMQGLRCLESKLLRNSNMAQAYQNEINKLLMNQYARPIPNELWYLLHFGVLNPNKPGKLRLVFDAAAKCNETSLNDNLLTRPDWLTSIVGVLLRFRTHRIAFVGDVKEMFNQVLISDEDAAAQCFIWRSFNTEEEPTVYQMKAMLFGITSSPFVAQFVKNYNAKKFEKDEPKAVRAIVEDHYVDDYLGGEETVEDAVQLILSVISIHKQGGFEIRGFISNSSEVLNQLPDMLRSEKLYATVGEKGADQKVLGII